VRELLPLRSHHVVVLLERVLQPQQLRRGERGPDSFGLPGQRVVQEEALRAGLVACEGQSAGPSGGVCITVSVFIMFMFYYTVTSPPQPAGPRAEGTPGAARASSRVGTSVIGSFGERVCILSAYCRLPPAVRPAREEGTGSEV